MDISFESPSPCAWGFLLLSVHRRAPNHAASCCVSQLVMTRSALRCGKSRPPVRVPGGRGAWMIPLLGQWALQLVENQLAMLLEYAQRRFERMEHRLSNPQGVADIQRVLEDYALASDVGLHFGKCNGWLGQDGLRIIDRKIPAFPIAKNQNPPQKVYLGEAQLWRGQARMCRGGGG